MDSASISVWALLVEPQVCDQHVDRATEDAAFVAPGLQMPHFNVNGRFRNSQVLDVMRARATGVEVAH